MEDINYKLSVFLEYNKQLTNAKTKLFYAQETTYQYNFIWADFVGNKIDEFTFRKKMENLLKAFSKELEAISLRLKPVSTNLPG